MLLFLKFRIEHIKHLQYESVEIKNYKQTNLWYSTRQNFKLHIYLFYFFNNSLILFVCNNNHPNFHHNQDSNLKSFPSKSNLKIKLIKHFNLVLLNLHHSLSNIALPPLWISLLKSLQ